MKRFSDLWWMKEIRAAGVALRSAIVKYDDVTRYRGAMPALDEVAPPPPWTDARRAAFVTGLDHLAVHIREAEKAAASRLRSKLQIVKQNTKRRRRTV